ncbi:MAG: hypothetical protein WCH44_11745 [Betaproteobacteria bacterium]
MTVAAKGVVEGRLLSVTAETAGAFGEVGVVLAERQGQIHADLSVGANVASAIPLRANSHLSNRGVQLFGAGFVVTPDEAATLGLGIVAGLERHIRDYRNGRDLTATPRDVMVIDAFGLSADELRSCFPAVYQWLLERVKPERDQNNRPSRRDNWWLFGETNPKLRRQLAGLPRYIATVETAKHRTFQFLDASVLPDNKLIAIALEGGFHLGVLSSGPHGYWALAAGSWLGVGNDPVYVKTKCFETFPFPGDDTGLTAALVERIRLLAEQIDGHRKARQAAHASLTLTGMYNVLERLRTGEALTDSDRVINANGLVGVLRTLQDELDAAVLESYGWSDLNLPADKDALLLRLAALNARRAAEEAAGTVRWLRPSFQHPSAQGTQSALDMGTQAQTEESDESDGAESTTSRVSVPIVKRPWPSGLPEQIKTVAEVLSACVMPLTLPALEAHFTARGRWRDRLPTILDTLEALGRARRVDSDVVRWQSQ